MTKENFTSINVVIDESGSMGPLTLDTIGGFNKFLNEQKQIPGEATFTLCIFNDDYRLVHDFVKLSDVPDLTDKTYRPNGFTALLDAVGSTMNSVGTKLAAMKEEDRPSKVIFLIITDGAENASQAFKRDKIREMISHQKDVYSWEFVFMGANIDAVTEGTNLGISMQNSMQYDASSVGTKGLYQNISDSMTRYRSSGPKSSGFFDANLPRIIPVAPATPKGPKAK